MDWVLLVEDDSDIRDTASEVLRDHGYPVRVARDGAEALAMLRNEADGPCLVLADLLMPGMNGHALISALKADMKLAALPVVAMTASPGSAPQGIRRVLRKPFSIDDLLGVVEECCETGPGPGIPPSRKQRASGP